MTLHYVSCFSLLQMSFSTDLERETFVYFFVQILFFRNSPLQDFIKRTLSRSKDEQRTNPKFMTSSACTAHSQKNRAQPNSVSRFCQNYFCSTLETSSGGSKAKTVNDHGWLSFTRFDLTPFIEMLQKLCNSRVQNKHRSMSVNFLAFFQGLRHY